MKDGLATTNPDLGTGDVRQPARASRAVSHAMAFDTSAALGTISSVLAGGNVPDVELGVGAVPGADARQGRRAGAAAVSCSW